MKKLLCPLFLALVTACLFSGCSSGVERIGLQVQLSKLERKADGTAVATLVFSNPNIGSVNIASSSHELTLNGRAAGTLKVAKPLGMPPQQTITATATLQAKTSLSSGPASYQLKSVLVMSVLDDDTENYKTQSSGSVTVE